MILAVILVIAVPQIMSTITESRKGALASSAKLIASSAESAYMSNQTLGVEKTISCQDVSNYTNEDYASCSIKFVDGKAKVTLIGKGKFEGMCVSFGTKEDAEVVDKCPTAVQSIESFATESNTEGLITDDTADHNIRYAGASPKNYVNFNGEDWRIIGLFNVTTSSGKTEKLMKIVKDTPFSTGMAWDSSASSVNTGGGVDEWSQADLMTMLNTYYIGEPNSQCRYCNGKGQETCSNDCSSSVTPIDSAYRNMIEEVVWNTGAIESASSIERSSAYTQERGTTGKICTSGTGCNDTVERATTWTGKVGLIYPSDYGYASTSGTDIKNSAIGTTNWLNLDSIYWTLSPRAHSSVAGSVWMVHGRFINSFDTSFALKVRPSVFLKSDVSITGGDGSSSTTAYQLSI